MPKTSKKELVTKAGDVNVLELVRFTRDDVNNAAQFTKDQLRVAVNGYYMIQKMRTKSSLREHALNRKAEHGRMITDDPYFITIMKENLKRIEDDMGKLLRRYVMEQPLGQWACSLHGIGPIAVAGLMGHVDLRIAVNAGNLWSYAGQLDPAHPKMQWQKGKKRGYNPKLKTLCWNIGDSICKLSLPLDKMNLPDEEILKLDDKARKNLFSRALKMDDEKGLYLRTYRERKVFEHERNERGYNRDYAALRMKKAMAENRRISEEQREAWLNHKIPPGGVDRRARRYAVKLFLSHYHHVGTELMNGKPPPPWVIEHGGHTKFIPPPNWPMKIAA